MEAVAARVHVEFSKTQLAITKSTIFLSVHKNLMSVQGRLKL